MRPRQDAPLPLHLCQVLESEFEAVHEKLDRKPSWELTLAQVDTNRLASALMQDSAALFLRAGNFQIASAEDLVKALNSIIVGPLLDISKPEFASKPESALRVVRDFHDAVMRRIPLVNDSILLSRFKDFLVRSRLQRKSIVLKGKEVPWEQPDALWLKELGTDTADPAKTIEALRYSPRLCLAALTDRLLDADEVVKAQSLAADSARVNRMLLEVVFGSVLRNADDERLKAIYSDIHARKDRSALCLSGGGIRSATFALGLIQALARHKLLDKFDFLSTVSGGGYIGGWLSSWIKNAKGGSKEVFDRLSERGSPSKPEPSTITYLRDYTNYLSPRLGLLSVDTWTLVGTYLRNLLANWLLFVPVFCMVLLAPRLLLSIMALGLNQSEGLANLGFGFALGVFAINEITSKRTADLWRPVTQRQFLVHSIAPLVAAAVVLCVYWHAPLTLGSVIKFVPSGMSAVVFDHGELISFAGFGAIFHLAGAISFLRRSSRVFGETVGTILSGLMGGLTLLVVRTDTRIFRQTVLRLVPLPLGSILSIVLSHRRGAVHRVRQPVDQGLRS